ncbi:excisionase family DNA-binding protein [Bacillus sp. Marseille-Q3570]|uniref:excisionase family DNA-binding protein n=1 Tax=Bacillus sp. Marseille-Q3570 TaxID=2963522 RepID=UPI0028DB3978|nr:excisionase family DNA-binding protein [Bacillus sp. Marseille-Q3570]
MKMERQTLTAKQAAEYVNVSYWLILEMAKRKRIPHYRVGKRVLFSKEGLSEWIKAQESSSIEGNDQSQFSSTGLRKLQR